MSFGKSKDYSTKFKPCKTLKMYELHLKKKGRVKQT